MALHFRHAELIIVVTIHNFIYSSIVLLEDQLIVLIYFPKSALKPYDGLLQDSTLIEMVL